MATTKDLTNAIAEREKPKDIQKDATSALLAQMVPQARLALPDHMKGAAESILRIALTRMREDKKLAQCEPLSVFAAAVRGAQMGLRCDAGQAFLVPYWNEKKRILECTFVPGWKGLVDLANRSGMSDVWTGVIFKDQQRGVDWNYLSGARVWLEITRDSDLFDEAEISHAYAVGFRRGSDRPVIELWSAAKIRAHLDRYNKQAEKHYAFRNWEMYMRKVVLLQVLKYMPRSIDLDAAIMHNDQIEVEPRAFSWKELTHAEAPALPPPSTDLDFTPEGVRVNAPKEKELATASMAQEEVTIAHAGTIVDLGDDELFAMADAAAKRKDYETAFDLARGIKKPGLRKIIEDQCPEQKT